MLEGKLSVVGLGFASLALVFTACDMGSGEPVESRHASDPQPQDKVPPEGDDGEDEGEDWVEDEAGEDGDEGCNDTDHPGDDGGDEDEGGDDQGDGMGEEGGEECSTPAPFDLDALADYEAVDENVITDCDVGGGYGVSSWRASEPQEAQLWVSGVYQTRSDHSFNNHPMGDGAVSWSRPGDNVLVLGAYEPTTWDVEVVEGGELYKVIAIGYHTQIVNAPDGVEVLTFSHADGDCYFECGYALPGEGGGCEGEDLVGLAEHLTGRTLTGFDGCYDATNFAY